eukprot:TRINITY_DN4223_c0_g1_i1.p1 TRINITY_DN4223_c0_g1~~TRINITY_DN4223_c0_g1_i1.p1  ORF type:complete len:663 (+),score=156.82 TRINITY_DN4223_c0_g1_i1:65-1990(+)
MSSNKRVHDSVDVGEDQPSLKKDKKDHSKDQQEPETNSVQDTVDPQEQANIGPIKPKRRELKFESLYLSALPSAELYEKSYMHRDVVTHLAVSNATDFIITGSCDGHIKFWKKQKLGIEFVKHFRAHLGSILDLALSADGLYLASTSSDKTIKIFDVLNFDMINLLTLSFTPTLCEWVFHGSNKPILACAEQGQGFVHFFDITGQKEVRNPLTLLAPLTVMKYSEKFDCLVTGDEKGMIDYWDLTTLKTPNYLPWKFKSDTALYDLAKSKATCTSLTFSRNSKYFACMCSDKIIRIYKFFTAQLFRKFDENISLYNELQKEERSIYKVDEIDFGRRMAVEKELKGNSTADHSINLVFDHSENFILYSTILGIKVVNIKTNRVVRLLGKSENTVRFLKIALYQGQTKGGGGVELSSTTTSSSSSTGSDPTLFCTAFKKHRFYYFTQREPEEPDTEDVHSGRDVFNEKPTKEEQTIIAQPSNKNLGKGAIIHTTFGDIHIKLFPDECPKTVENFTTHSRNGYYNGLIFHRVIKGFMIQTGDPLGDGTGGTSIWGHDFEDEFNRALRHDRPGTVSMANAGKDTNGSQFFITSVPISRLDFKHTVFARVVKGMDVVFTIEKVKTDKDDKPLQEIKIINIKIVDSI